MSSILGKIPATHAAMTNEAGGKALRFAQAHDADCWALRSRQLGLRDVGSQFVQQFSLGATTGGKKPIKSGVGSDTGIRTRILALRGHDNIPGI